MATRRSTQLAIAYSPTFKRQSAWDVPMPASELTKAFPATTRNYLAINETVEEIFDCTGEDMLTELVTGRLARLTVDFDVDPNILAGLMAFLYGVAAAPSGGTNEVQTLTVTATGGGYQLRVTNGYNVQTTTILAFNANAAAIQAALDALSNISPGDIVVGGAGPFTFTAAGNLIDQDLDLIQVVNPSVGGMTGGTATMVETTPGAGRTAAISRLALYQLPLLTLYIGFRGSDKQPVIFKNVVISNIRVTSQSRQRVTGAMELIGSGDLQYAVGFTMPACQDIKPIRFGDCAVIFDGVDYMASGLVRDFTFTYDNAILTGDNPFTGQGIDATRLERADRRPSGIDVGILGEPGDAIHTLARAKTVMVGQLRIGPASNNVTVNVPQGALRLDTPQLRFEGEANESVLRLNMQPRKVSTDATTPSNVTVKTSQSVAYLISA